MTLRIDIEECELDDDLVLYEGKPFTGLLFSLYEVGGVLEEMEYRDGLPHGWCHEFYESGELKKQWYARNGRTEGQLVKFFESGGLEGEEMREFGVVVTSKRWDAEGNLLESKELDPNSAAYAYVQKCRKGQLDG